MRIVLLACLSICASVAEVPSGGVQRDGGVPAPTDDGSDIESDAPVETPPKSVVRTITPPKRWIVSLAPRYVLGADMVRGRKRHDPAPGKKVLCPSDKEYCIDVRHSDRGTCMFPEPIAIKICLDETCATSPENENIFKQYGEDSYCKDRQNVDGRVCQWIDSIPCSCSKFDLEYVDAVYFPEGELTPEGYKVAKECKYADNYRGENKRQWAEPAVPKAVPNVHAGVVETTSTKSSESMLMTSAAALLACGALMVRM